MKEEEWRDIAGYEGLYQVSDLGRVRSLDYNHTGRAQVLKPTMARNGYLLVWLFKNGKSKSYLVHRLVAEAFLSNADGLPEVNHNDENKTNNAVSNLEWCDRSYNVNYGTGIDRMAAALSKPVQQLTLDGILVALWPSTHEAARQTGVYQGNICSCCNGKLRSTGGYKWQYAN